MAYLLDTNVISEFRKQERCDRHVQAWRDSVTEEDFFLSVLTMGELWHGVEKLRPKDRAGANGLDRWVRGLELTFSERILPVTLEISQRWGALCPQQPLPAADGLLAATALWRDLTIATRNIRDFQRSGVDMINPFEF